MPDVEPVPMLLVSTSRDVTGKDSTVKEQAGPETGIREATISGRDALLRGKRKSMN